MDAKNRKDVYNYVKQSLEKEKRKEEMISNSSYIEWLTGFVNNNKKFYSDSWLYDPERIEEKDRNNVNNLELFFNKLLDELCNNYIYPKVEENSISKTVYYMIKYKKTYFKIGILVGQGSVIFCEKIERSRNYTDFNDILTRKIEERKEMIDKDLEKLEEIIYNMLDNNIPINTIINKINSIDKDYKNQKLRK